MAASSNSVKFTVSNLTNQNYQFWKFKAKMLLIKEDCQPPATSYSGRRPFCLRQFRHIPPFSHLYLWITPVPPVPAPTRTPGTYWSAPRHLLTLLVHLSRWGSYHVSGI
ncbi:uncharacterized protein LOC143818061 [Ranitomeya variabilis]|uniref:uncharacterized protein LOC143818061 n=1 Tax=Ranitomeya variabilis TaxID=490064 RepID=UPI004056D760